MLKRIDVVYGTETDEQALILPILGVTPKDSLLLQKVTGLNPPDIDLFIGEYSRDGGIYQGRRVPPRNVVLTININPNYALGETVAGLRDLMYRAFIDPFVNADYSQLLLREDDGRVRYLVGYTEKFETEIFDVETLAQISMICPDPYIRDVNETAISNAGGWFVTPFVYPGTAETGFVVDILVNSNTGTLTLANNNRTMVITYPFLTNDVVTINTNRGSRNMYVTRTGVPTSLITYLSPLSRWLELHSQANSMSVYGATSTAHPAGITSLRFTPAYWGV